MDQSGNLGQLRHIGKTEGDLGFGGIARWSTPTEVRVFDPKDSLRIPTTTPFDYKLSDFHRTTHITCDNGGHFHPRMVKSHYSANENSNYCFDRVSMEQWMQYISEEMLKPVHMPCFTELSV